MGILTGVGKSKPSASSRKKQWAGDSFTGLGNDFVDLQILEVLGSTNERVEKAMLCIVLLYMLQEFYGIID